MVRPHFMVNVLHKIWRRRRKKLSYGCKKLEATELRVSIIQMRVADGDVQANIARGLKFIKEAAEGSDFVVLPELWTTGYDFNAIMEYAEGEGKGWSNELLSSIAEEYGVYIISSAPLKEDGKLYDAAFLIGPDGTIGTYRKIHLFRPYGEDKMFMAGNELGYFNTSFGGVGIAICYDLRFPELFRLLAMKGAKVIFVPASWGAPRALQWRTLLRARAAENQVFMVGANKVGKSEVTGEHYSGNSAVYDPFGFELMHSEESEQVLTVNVDLRTVDKIREYLPIWHDRRTDLYGIGSAWGVGDPGWGKRAAGTSRIEPT